MGGVEWESVVRVVYPTQDIDQVWPLYALDWTQPMLSDAQLDARVDMNFARIRGMNQSTFQRLVRRGLSGGKVSGATDASFEFSGRDSLRVLEGGRTSLCTFFNAFPAGYWRRWTRVRTVRFEAQVRGKGRIVLYRSNGRGLFTQVGEIITSGGRMWKTVSAEIPLAGTMDGGFCWFDVEAGKHSGDVDVRGALWQVPVECRTTAPGHSGTLSIAITTFNRAPYCMNQLKTISKAPALRERLDTIYCTDQGSDHVCDQPDFKAVAKELGDQLTYIQQRNLGGSGGFSRGMFETLEAGKSDYCMLLDDDAISEPEAILRAVQFADYTVRPTLVGGGMLHLDNRTMLYTQGEVIDWSRMWMAPSLELGYNHDFAAEPLRDSPERHLRIDEDFNGWWMCLIPVKVIKSIGLSLPVFIKFDDIEYSLRARKAGFPTVCLPGVAVWHQAWHSKDPSRTWEEYFFPRNRWIAALLMEPARPTKHFMFETMYADITAGLRFIYSAMALHHAGLEDIMKGPAYIVESFPNKMAEVRKLRAEFEDTHSKPSFDDYPAARHAVKSPRRHPHTTKQRYFTALIALALSMFSNTDATGAKRPDVAITAQDSYWTAWLSSLSINSVLVTSPDGNSVSWLKRNDPYFRKSLLKGFRLSRKLMRNWRRLSAEYRDYNMASVDTWRKIFAES